MVSLYEKEGVVNADLFDDYAQRVAKKLIDLELPSSQFR